MVIIGLGNSSQEYKGTRHNAGFMMVDFLADKLDLAWERRKDLSSLVARKNGLWLVKPLVYMNQSGQVVKRVVDKVPVDLNSLYLVHDELDLRLGEWKLTFAKSSPLHKGILSVEQYLKSKDFWRVRVGIDNRDSQARIEGEKYVLQRFLPQEEEILAAVFGAVKKEVFDKMETK